MKRGKATNRLLDFYLGIPVLNLLATFRRPAVFPTQPERIGLLFNPALGDTLLASVATQDARRIFPKAKLILFAGSSNLAAARLLPNIDEIEVLPINRPLKAIRILRQRRLDLMLDFTAWQRITALYTFLSGAQFKVGFERKDQYRHRGYDKTVPHRGDCHELENLHRLTRALGAQTASVPHLLIPEGKLPDVMLPGSDVIVFHPWASGARSWLREWPDEYWVELARKVMRPGRIFLVTGSPADASRCDVLCQKIRTHNLPVEPLIGRDGLAGVARVLQRAEILVSVNTGIMHLGAILGVPTISLNGPTSALRWGPVGPRVANVCPPDGSGAFLDLGFEYRGHTTNVMGKISVDDVVREVQQLGRVSHRDEVAVAQERY